MTDSSQNAFTWIASAGATVISLATVFLQVIEETIIRGGRISRGVRFNTFSSISMDALDVLSLIKSLKSIGVRNWVWGFYRICGRFLFGFCRYLFMVIALFLLSFSISESLVILVEARRQSVHEFARLPTGVDLLVQLFLRPREDVEGG